MKNKFILILLLSCSFIPKISFSQDGASVTDKVFNLPGKFFSSVNSKSDKFQEQLLKSTDKYLNRLAKKELKLQRQLAKKDSTAAKALFGDVNKRYDSLRNVLNAPASQFQNAYSGHLDSMKTAFSFLDQQKLIKQSPELEALYTKYGGVQGKLNQTNFIQQQLKERQQQLKDKLQNFGLGKQFKKYQEGVYYYRAQLEEYKNIFEDPKKMESALLKVATKIPEFNKFFNKHSQLASLFRLPGTDEASMAGIDGLQTRGMVMQELEQRMGGGPNAQRMMSQSIANAQSGLDKAKDKLNSLGNSGADMDMPDFKPAQQKTKSFLKRLEYGTNVQSTRSNSVLPVSTDFGFSLGYKLSSKSVVGVGSSYRVGWGRDIRHLSISHEGVGIRTFYEMKLKGSFWLTGGGEMNYMSSFNRIEELKDYSDWQQSVLAGLSKKYSLGKKMKGNIQILYDFLYSRNIPRTQPVIFRFGYKL